MSAIHINAKVKGAMMTSKRKPLMIESATGNGGEDARTRGTGHMPVPAYCRTFAPTALMLVRH